MAGFCSSSRRLMSKLVSSELRDLDVTSFWLLSNSGSLPYWTKCCYELSTGCLQSSLLCCVTATHSVSNTVRHCVLAVCSKSVANLRKSVIYGNYCPGCVVVYRTSLQELENTVISTMYYSKIVALQGLCTFLSYGKTTQLRKISN